MPMFVLKKKKIEFMKTGWSSNLAFVKCTWGEVHWCVKIFFFMSHCTVELPNWTGMSGIRTSRQRLE